MFPKLETDRLWLREITNEDKSNIFSIFSNDEVTKHYGLKSFDQTSQAEGLISAFAANYQSKKGIRWGIERKDEKGLIGTVGFNLWSTAHKRAEIGYEILPEFWRVGYTSEAVAKIVEYGFNELELTRIGAIVFVDNLPSNQLLQKLGFEQEGILKKYMYQNDQAYDVNVFAKLRSY